ncbi:acyltransferase family protein [Streptomyces gamaensis]|uniref:Acyltransferase family protein n=1 Tax=Streptomyces gamaensis TaxID=1763542 RepID=A0ABW0YTI9_9ACTN
MTFLTAVRRGVARPTVPEATSKPGRLYLLDGLRLVAALVVVAFHYVGRDNGGTGFTYAWGKPTSEVFPAAQPIAAYGWLGVQLFFIISGFVICRSCWGRTVRQFAISRFLRMYPAYWFGVLLTSSILLLTGVFTWDSPTRSRILANLTMFQSPMGMYNVDGVYWTLWAEMRFYLLFAIVTAFGLTYRRVLAFCGGWLALSLVAPKTDNTLIQMFGMPDASPFFVAGIVMYLMHRFRPTLVLWLLLGATWLLAWDQLPGLMAGMQGYIGHRQSQIAALIIVSVFYAVVLTIALARRTPRLGTWITSAGALTYPLYLLHQEIGWQVIHRLHDTLPPWVLVVLLVSAMLVAAWLVHRLIERPVATALKRWIGRLGLDGGRRAARS